MKKFKLSFLLGTLALMLLFSACKQSKEQSYTISGTMPSGADYPTVYLYFIGADTLQVVDSAVVQNGTFTFKGTAPDSLTLALVHPGTPDDFPAIIWQLIVEPGNIILDTLSQFATGTPNNDGLDDWMTQIQDIMMTSADPAAIKTFFAEHWSEHSSDFVGAFMLNSLAMYLDFPFVDSLASQVPDDVRSLSLLRPFFDQIETIRRMQPGQPFTDVALATVDGTPASLSDYIGKGAYVLVDFWASWCGPCRQAMPELKSVVKKHPDLKVVGIAVSDELDKTKAAISDLGISWTVLSDPDGISAKAYGVNAIPAMILFSPDGTILARDFLSSDLDGLLTQAL